MLRCGSGAPISAVSLRGEIEHVALRLGDRRGVERLAAGEDVQPAPFGPGGDHFARQRRHALLVDPERLGAAAHLHARAAQLEIGIDPDRQPRRRAEAVRRWPARGAPRLRIRG